MEENKFDEVDHRSVQIVFARHIPDFKYSEHFKTIEPTFDRKLIWCLSWDNFVESFKLKPKSITINAHHLKGESFVEVLNMIETLSKLVGCSTDMTITLGVDLATPHFLIKEAQKSKIMGIIPSGNDFGFEETLKGYKAQWANINYWPKSIIDQLPGAKKLTTRADSTEIKLTNRQKQIFNIVMNRGCSNKHIAKLMGISESTVKLHLSHIFKKFGVKNRTQLAVFCKDITIS